MFKKQTGITLVALVITIIVLLILAGVSISMVVGNNGVLTQAENAVKKTADAEIEQAVGLAAQALELEYRTALVDNDTKKRAEYFTADKFNAEMSDLGYTVKPNSTTIDVSTGTATTTIVVDGEEYGVSFSVTEDDGLTGTINVTAPGEESGTGATTESGTTTE